MNEATPINKGYQVIKKFAEQLNSNTNLNKIYNIDPIVKNLGGMINFVSAEEYKNVKFVRIFDINNFDISLLNGIDNNFKRLLLIQALGHYMLHGESGKKLCCISSASNSLTSQEGFWFALSVLIPDEQFLKLKHKFDYSYCSNLFRVPEFAIKAKIKIINQEYLNKEMK